MFDNLFENRNRTVSELIKLGDYLGRSLRENVSIFKIDVEGYEKGGTLKHKYLPYSVKVTKEEVDNFIELIYNIRQMILTEQRLRLPYHQTEQYFHWWQSPNCGNIQCCRRSLQNSISCWFWNKPATSREGGGFYQPKVCLR